MIKRIRTYCLITFWLVAFSSCAIAQSLPTQNWAEWNAATSPLFPEGTWMQYQTPEEAGWSSEKLSSVQHWIDEGESAAVMVIYNGAILAQWGQTNRRFKCHSIRKSLLSALYGKAVQQGLIDMNETLASIGIDDDVPLTEVEKTASVSDLLKSRSGVYLPAAYETKSMAAERPGRGSQKPGAYWHYNNWDFNVLSSIYNRETSADMFKAFEAQIATPIEMQDFELRHTYYHLEAEKSRHPAYPFRMSARDLARFGLLYLNEGRWKDDQILSANWVQESTDSHSAVFSGGYGYMWWTAGDNTQLGKLGTYWARGYGGHYIYVIPGAKLVLVHRANTYLNKKVNRIYIQAIVNDVLKARTGPPRLNPKLVRQTTDQTPVYDHTLSGAQISNLIGEYKNDRVAIQVDEYQGHLQITNPYSGRFFLFAQSNTDFIVEDEQYRGEFVLNDAGVAETIRIWGYRDKPYELNRATFE